MKNEYSKAVLLIIGLWIALAVLSFSPLVIPNGVLTPLLFGMPRTLWAGILISIGFIIICILSVVTTSETGSDGEK